MRRTSCRSTCAIRVLRHLQVFDNLYFVGGKIHSAWALKTSHGFILLDTIYPYNSEELIIGGMQRLGSTRTISST